MVGPRHHLGAPGKVSAVAKILSCFYPLGLFVVAGLYCPRMKDPGATYIAGIGWKEMRMYVKIIK